ncbi:hypothetical protein BDY24DRAFT_343299 [Mrakia frigida]|uniref:uncharacterized protein n=1 Tax=Mrakia frigida TaxID=29902 RepID=UPI003FCC21E8
MSQATSVNVNLHVEEFKKLLSQEVARSMHDLGRIREEKKHLEQQIAELFATKVKFSDGSRPTSQQPQPRRPSQPLASPHPPPQAPLPPVPSGGPALAPPRF